MTVDEIIKLAGGAAKIAGESADAIKADAVYKWPKIGIPDRHWPLIIRLAPEITPQQLFEANITARTEKAA